MLSGLEKALERCYRVSVIHQCCRLYSSTDDRFKYRRDVKRVNPARVRPQRTQEDSGSRQMDAEITQYRKEFAKEIERHGDVLDEPDLSNITNVYDEHLRETERIKMHIKNKRMGRKHFGELQPKEIGLLTWAEKENIRYLVESDPETWTPETIAEAYPISPEGVTKLTKSKVKLRTLLDVKQHDEKIMQKIKGITSGAIPMTEELEKRLKIRELIPLKVGELGVNGADHLINGQPPVLGEFASLVAPQNSVPNEKSVQRISDGDFCPEYDLKQQLTQDELRKMMHLGKRFTFREFEENMKKGKADSLSADMKYMLGINTSKDSQFEQSEPGDIKILEKRDYSSLPSKVQKYKTPDDTGKVNLNMEGGDAYVYKPESGYEKPYKSALDKIPENISIPDRLRKDGATYKVGDCYYDDDGEFLYKVV